MLVLERKKNKSIIIKAKEPGRIRIVVTNIDPRGRSVKIGIEAPREMNIRREEVMENVERELPDSMSKDYEDGLEE